jgi:hypothetical protein
MYEKFINVKSESLIGDRTIHNKKNRTTPQRNLSRGHRSIQNALCPYRYEPWSNMGERVIPTGVDVFFL